MNKPPQRTFIEWEDNKEEAQEILDSWIELQRVTRAKIETVLWLREKPTKEQTERFKKNFGTICI